jgi:hypothetical protein
VPEGRGLAAVMVTDMIGYSALTQRDEALTLRLLTEYRQVVRQSLGQFGGREVKTMGDAPESRAGTACRQRYVAPQLWHLPSSRFPTVPQWLHFMYTGVGGCAGTFTTTEGLGAGPPDCDDATVGGTPWA